MVSPSYVPDPREQEAYDEVARTRIAPALASSILAGFLVLLAAGPILEILAVAQGRSLVWRPLAGPRAAGLAAALDALRGSIAELELRFDERSELVRRVRPWVQAALLRVGRYGNERAYAGRGGWLVFRPDFDHLTSARTGPEFEGDPVRAIVDFRDQLAERGIGLLLLPAPVKPSIHVETLARELDVPAPIAPPGQRGVIEAVAAAGVEIVDPATSLHRTAAAGAPTYLVADTHWRPQAVDVVAREVAVALRASSELPVGDPNLLGEDPQTIDGLGDTAVLLDLPRRVARRLYQRIETRRVVARDGAPWRPTRGAPVLLLGDSFSAVFSEPDLGWGSGAGLAERLSLELGLPVDRIVRNAGGASATRQALVDELTRDARRLDGVRVVVWEFAARELSQGAWRLVRLPASSSVAP
jgi:alginate O-acetyltransferase complex protein AlgJ